MILLLLVLIPLACGIICCLPVGRTARCLILVAAALMHLGLCILLLCNPLLPGIPGWLAADDLSKLVLIITSILFTAVSVYAWHYLRSVAADSMETGRLLFFFSLQRDAGFTGFLLFFLAAMSLVAVSRHMGLLWIAVEATTLTSAPLIYFQRQHKSLEATWKYLIVCSVGIALALLGIYFLAGSAAAARQGEIPLALDQLSSNAAGFNPVWLKTAFLLILVGFGTKLGLVPMHTWLPEAHSEAPSLVSALLSGALLNGSLLAILRMYRIMSAAGLEVFAAQLLQFFGLLSMLTAAFLMLSKTDYKRLLAYSSIEHMGILAFATGLGSLAGYASMLHMVSHSFIKAALFLTAGNILAIYRTKQVSEVQGLLKRMPASGLLLFTGFLALIGMPPSGLFTSELLILKASLLSGNWLLTLLYLAALLIAFLAIGRIVFAMLFGSESAVTVAHLPARVRENGLSLAPPLVLLLVALLVGLWIPGFLHNLLNQAAATGGGLW